MTVPPSPDSRAGALAPDGKSAAVLRAGTALAHRLADGARLDAELLRGAMEGALAASDETGAWLWRDAYDAAEIAQLLVLRRLGPAMRAATPPARLAMLTRLAALAPAQTRRSEEAQAHQLFSTPLPFGAVAALAAGIRSDDLVLEPSTGNGLLAVHAELTGARLALNEIAPDRARLLEALFPTASVSAHDAEAIHDRLDPTVRPTVVLMNPPFSASPHVDDRRAAATWHHVASALARLRPGGRLVAVTADWFAPENSAWAAAFARLTERGGHLVLTVPIARGAFARQGTSVATRLSVFDKGAVSADAVATASRATVDPVAALYAAVEAALLPRLAVAPCSPARSSSLRTVLAARAAARPTARHRPLPDPHRDPRSEAIDLSFETAQTEAAGPGLGSLGAAASGGLYEPYAPQTIRIPGAQPHPTPLVESAAMASVPPPRPSYRPRLPQRLVTEGVLSDAQLATLVYAGEAHAGHLESTFTVDETGDRVGPALLGADEYGQPLVSREAVERRDRMIERLAALPAVQSALDQIVQHFGTAVVAEVTGRSRRIVRRTCGDGRSRLAVERRAASAKITEAQAFMDGTKRVLVFSDAGGTGRSYHSDLGAKNQARRVHYLLEPGWRADSAVQGLGRTHRTNQASPPLIRPVTTDVRGEKRFTSTIARRLDALGAITRGQRQTGGQNLFLAEDNLESDYARMALRQFYSALHRGQVADCTLGAFEAATGLSLTDRDGSLREELPPIPRFLNRMLAPPIALQNHHFAVFEAYLTALVEGARAGGAYDLGVETILADSLAVTDRRTVYIHPKTGAETRLLSVRRRERLRPLPVDEALQLAQAEPGARLLVNARSGHAAVQVPAWSLTREDGSVDCHVRLIRPTGRDLVAADGLVRSHWRDDDRSLFAATWKAEVARAPEHREGTLHVLCGLLLPIWRRLPVGAARVYRLTTDAGERVIGRVVPDDALPGVLDRLGGAVPPPILSPADAFSAVLERGATLALQTDLQVRRSLVMGAHRVEVTGFGDGAVGGLKALGLYSEIIAWRLRLFVPTDGRGPVILGSLLGRHPIGGVSTGGVGDGRAVAA